MSGRVAIVTGAGSGIGAATVRALAREGHTVAFCARSGEAVAGVQAEVEAAGGRALGLTADMSDPVAVEGFLARVREELGEAAILVNNVGASPSRNFQRMGDEEWLGLLELNLMAAVRCTRGVLGGMRKQRWGRIVMVSSMAAKHPDAALIDYAAGKAALNATAKALARRYGRDGVLVNSVLPGLIHTAMWDRASQEIAAATNTTAEAVIAEMSKQVPVGRYGTPDDVASVIAFLASDAASYVNGTAIDVDGGLSSSVH